jgi:uncharacterized membrane-anchored protein YitT (DUF2179 family)
VKARILFSYLGIVLGSSLTALGLVAFTNPAQIAPGGVSGIATILFYALGLNPGLMILVLSIPLFLIGLRIFGHAYGIKSLLGTVSLSLFTSLFLKLIGPYGVLDMTKDLNVLLGAVFGGVVMGIGMGIVMRSGSNTGGTDIVAQIISHYTPLSMGMALTMVDGLVIAVSALFFGLQSALYAIITVYITGISIDKVVLGIGTNSAKTVYIISSKSEEIQAEILKVLERGGTVLPGKGMYTGTSRPVIMTVISNNQISTLKSIVYRLDKSAFLVFHQAYWVMGEGFAHLEADKTGAS